MAAGQPHPHDHPGDPGPASGPEAPSPLLVTSRRTLLRWAGLGSLALGGSLLAACTPPAQNLVAAGPGSMGTPAAPGSPAATPTAPVPMAAPTAAPVPAVTAAATQQAALAAATATPLAESNLACIVTPAQTEGPYFVNTLLNRSDIRGGMEGLPLTVIIRVARVSASGCVPYEGAVVDIWHCNAAGAYSGVSGAGQASTVGQQWLRGYQVADARGVTRFETIYPGWYQGRTVHIHAMVRTSPTEATSRGFVTQFYFDEAVTDQVYARAPYAARGNRSTRNANDAIYRQGGSVLMFTLAGDPANGYVASYDIGVRV